MISAYVLPPSGLIWCPFKESIKLIPNSGSQKTLKVLV